MRIFIDDPEHGMTVRLHCSCGAGPVRLAATDGDVHAVFGACGAQEQLLTTGTVLVLSECRAEKTSPPNAKRRK